MTQDEITTSGYALKAEPAGAWRKFDEMNPVPGYFQFDWLSSAYPDLYHAFALSTVGLMDKLNSIVDFSGLDVVDIGAGTGRSSEGAAKRAKKVYAVDAYESVVGFGKTRLERGGIRNVDYIVGDRDRLPFADSSVDAAIAAWAELNPREAYRVLKNGGILVQMGSVPEALCGEISGVLAPDYPWIGKTIAPEAEFDPSFPDAVTLADSSVFGGVTVEGPVTIHRFTYIADYGDYREAAAITGRLYGPKAREYFESRKQSTYAWRLQIAIARVRK
jgi:ubiquinone/menaquinone biosynthesis C-methylase UbiE